MNHLPEFIDTSGLFGRLDVNRLLENWRPVQRLNLKKVTSGSHSTPPPGEVTAVARSKAIDESLYVLTPKPRGSPRILSFSKEQNYEGTVLAVNPDEGTFTAILKNLSHPGPDEEGDFDLTELNGDEYLAVPGALFTWTIGLQLRGTTKQRVSEIRFRRLPSITPDAIARAETEATKLADILREQDASEPFTSRTR